MTDLGSIYGKKIDGSNTLVIDFSNVQINGTLNLPDSSNNGYGVSGEVLTSQGTSAPTWSALPNVNVNITNGTGIQISGNYPDKVITNTLPNVDVNITNGTGIQISGNYPDKVITNTAPNVDVNLIQGTGIQIHGTYPNKTITNLGLTANSSSTFNALTVGDAGGQANNAPIININHKPANSNNNDTGTIARVSGVLEGTAGGKFVISTANSGGTVIERLRINNVGAVGFGGSTTANTAFGVAGEVLTSSHEGGPPVWSPTQAQMEQPLRNNPSGAGALTLIGGANGGTLNRLSYTPPAAFNTNSPTFTGTITGPNANITGTVTTSRIAANGTANVIELNQSTTGSATYYVMDNTVETGGKRYRFGYSGGSTDKGSFSILNQTDNFMPFVISNTGNVGIGATSPGEKLDVAGNIKITAALLSNQENTDVDTGTETVASVAIATYTAAFFDFVIKKTTNVRSGTVYACHDGTTVQFTETSTQDLGDTSDVTLSVDISGGNMRLRATTTSDNWSIKSLIRAI